MSTATAPIRETFTGRRDWLSRRRSCIGASESPAIFGVGYADQSPVTVWHSKISDEYDFDPKGEIKRLKIGRLIEPALRIIFREETGLEVEHPGDFVLYRHPELNWLGMSPDGLVEDAGEICPVELKNVDTFQASAWRSDDDEPPLKFNVQCQHQMAVLGSPRAYLMGLIGGNDPVVKVIHRNERFITAMLTKLREFWGYVERREIPPVDESFATAQILSHLFTEREGTAVQLPHEAIDWDIQLQKAKADVKDAEAREAKYANLLKASIGEATFGIIPGGGSYSWKTQSREEHVVKSSTFRVLRRLRK
jgi:putative phage-type endonuclease